jgi:hypothetical protein
MVAVGEAPAWPTQVRSTNTLHVVNELLANPVLVRDPGIAAYPDAVIDYTAEMLDEVTIYVRVDNRAWLARRYFDFDICSQRQT